MRTWRNRSTPPPRYFRCLCPRGTVSREMMFERAQPVAMATGRTAAGVANTQLPPQRRPLYETQWKRNFHPFLIGPDAIKLRRVVDETAAPLAEVGRSNIERNARGAAQETIIDKYLVCHRCTAKNVYPLKSPICLLDFYTRKSLSLIPLVRPITRI